MKAIRCSHRQCKCGNRQISRLALVDSEVYCVCSSCGRLMASCDKEEECNRMTKKE